MLMTITDFPPALLGLVLILLGLAMAGMRAGYWLFVVGIKSVVVLALIVAAVVGWYVSNAHAETSVPICDRTLKTKPDPCLFVGKAGLYLMSLEKDYSLNCLSYDCEAMMREYLKTGRIPDAIER